MVRIGLDDIYSFNKTHAPTGFDSTIQHLEKTSLQGIRGSTVQINTSAIEKLKRVYSTDVLWSRKQGKYDCWGNWIRQHKKTLSRVSGKRKKKYHPYGCVHRKLEDMPDEGQRSK